MQVATCSLSAKACAQAKLWKGLLCLEILEHQAYLLPTFLRLTNRPPDAFSLPSYRNCSGEYACRQVCLLGTLDCECSSHWTERQLQVPTAVLLLSFSCPAQHDPTWPLPRCGASKEEVLPGPGKWESDRWRRYCQPFEYTVRDHLQSQDLFVREQ